MEFPEKYTGNMLGKIPEKFSEISREIFQKICHEFLGKNSGENLRNFSKLILKTLKPSKSLKLGGIRHKNLLSKNSPEIPQSKSPKLENLEKFLTFVIWDNQIPW